MFYPLAKITPNLFTTGSEFFLVETQTDYKGYYYSAYDGRYFTGSTPTSESKELKKYSNLAVRAENIPAYDYNKIVKNSNIRMYPVHYTPIPTDEDYTKGNIQRYFVKRVNGDNSSILEVSKQNYENLKTNLLYLRIEFTWGIVGNPNDTPLAEGLSIPGVVNVNYKALLAADKYLPGLKSVLTNLVEFLKEI